MDKPYLRLSKTVRRNLTKNRSKLTRALKRAVEILEDLPDEKHASVAIVWLKNHWSHNWVVSGQVDYMLNDLHWSSSREFRLNDAGFKMFLGPNPDGSLWVYIHGDQRENHPEAYIILTVCLAGEGLIENDRLMREAEPLSFDWWHSHKNKLAPWCIKWLRKNANLVPAPVREAMKTGIAGW